MPICSFTRISQPGCTQFHSLRASTAPHAELTQLFRQTFSDSEGSEEGERIATLVANQLSNTPKNKIKIAAIEVEQKIVAACVFTQLHYEEDPRRVFIMAPVAVATERQRKGLGKALVAHGLQMLRDAGVDLVMTYGDPNYYGKIGFKQVSQSDAAAPFALQYPEGWLGQSLTSSPFAPLKGPSACVSALNDPAFW